MLLLALFILVVLFIAAIGGIVSLIAAGTVITAGFLVIVALLLGVGVVCLIFHGVWRVADPEAAKAAWEGRSVQGAIRLNGETKEQAETRLRERQESWAKMRAG